VPAHRSRAKARLEQQALLEFVPPLGSRGVARQVAATPAAVAALGADPGLVYAAFVRAESSVPALSRSRGGLQPCYSLVAGQPFHNQLCRRNHPRGWGQGVVERRTLDGLGVGGSLMHRAQRGMLSRSVRAAHCSTDRGQCGAALPGPGAAQRPRTLCGSSTPRVLSRGKVLVTGGLHRNGILGCGSATAWSRRFEPVL